ncbi:MAG TPA: AMP-binding protein [Acidimicrobiales bacterium]|nr:AMP-binding protein [Acidimicrobiales bacterium]
MNLATIIDPHPDDAVAIVSRGRPTTYGTLREEVAHLRGGLVGLGLVPGDRVAIVAANNWYFVASYLAVLGAGCVAVPLNPTSPTPELERQMAAVGVRAVVAGPTGRAAMEGLDRAALPALEAVVCAEAASLPGATTIDDLLGAEPVPVVDRAPGDLAVLVFTSGTAGSPKAAMLTHGNLLANLEQCQALPGRAQRPDDVVLGVLPFFHIFGLNVVLGLTLMTGASVVLVERFDPQTALETIANHAVTVISGAPTMWGAWAQLPGTRPTAFATVRLAASGAAKLDPQVQRTMAERFGVDLIEGYGLTEACPVVTTGSGADAPEGSVGVPVPGVRVRLVEPDGNDALVGDPGEIWVSGPNVFAGYWEDPEATSQAVDPEGWLHTGDIAVVDDDGHLFLVDRVKDLIIVSGFNVYPAEVEEVIAEHPAVAKVAVIGVPHPHSGEAVKAFVVVRPGASVEEDELIAHCEARLARYKCPQKVLFVDEIPESATGKVRRSVLR